MLAKAASSRGQWRPREPEFSDNERIRADVESVRVSLQHLEGGHNIFRPPDFDSADFKSKDSGCCAYLAQFQRGSGVAAVDQDR